MYSLEIRSGGEGWSYVCSVSVRTSDREVGSSPSFRRRSRTEEARGAVAVCANGAGSKGEDSRRPIWALRATWLVRRASIRDMTRELVRDSGSRLADRDEREGSIASALPSWIEVAASTLSGGDLALEL